MQFTESEIDFHRLDDRQFEELCLHLLEKAGYHALVWRQGGADDGRDIEATLTSTSPVVGIYSERWFVECKRYTGPVPIGELSSKIDWAKAKLPQHLLIIVSSYITQATRRWLDEITERAGFSTHLLEGEDLKRVVLRYPDLVARYFGDKYTWLLQDSIRSWITYGLLPDADRNAMMLEHLILDRLTTGELILLLIAALETRTSVSRRAWREDSEIDYGPLINLLLARSDAAGPGLSLPDAATDESPAFGGLGEGVETFHVGWIAANGQPPTDGYYAAVVTPGGSLECMLTREPGLTHQIARTNVTNSTDTAVAIQVLQRRAQSQSPSP